MTNTTYLQTGNIVTLNFQSLALSIQSLTQSIPIMKQIVKTPLNSYFLLTTYKCYDKSIKDEKPITQFTDDQVYYGEGVLFYHLLSGKFLCYNRDIESKSMIELTSTYKINCEFSIRPIFKCQTVVTRKIRSEQSIVLSPLETFNRQGNISMVVIKNEARKQNRCFVCMKKNEHTMINLIKVNRQGISGRSIRSINIYQICNIETKKNLFAESSKTKHRDIVTFTKSINELSSYFVVKPKKTDALGNVYEYEMKEENVEYNKPVFLFSWKQKKYLALNLIGEVCLSEDINQYCQFIIENYSDNSLTNQSVLRIKHLESDKYVGISTQTEDVQMISETRLIDTCFLVDVPLDNLRLNVFVNDAHDILQQELMGQTLTFRNKKTIFKVLQQLFNFIYGDLISITDFMSMKVQIQCKLLAKDQKLLADTGMLHTLLKLYRILLYQNNQQENGNQFEQKDLTEELNIISYIMMNIAGICYKNSGNVRSLINELPILYESISSNSGVIECLYHLFKDSKQILLILENTTHKIGKRQNLSFEVLLDYVSNQKFDMASRCKVIKLLEALIITNEKQKILSHEIIIIRFWQEKKLNDLLLTLKSNDHYDLMVFLPNKQNFEELDEMITMNKTFDKELKILKNQLELICSLCFKSSTLAFKYASSIIPEEMILRYLKVNLQPEFKEIFMKLLIDIYLSRLENLHPKSKAFVIINREKGPNRVSVMQSSSLRSNLIEQGEQLMQMTDFDSTHSKTLEKIQNLILEVTRKSIVNEIMDSSFYMNIKALRKFLALRILDQTQVRQFRALLTKFIANYIENKSKEKEKKKIIGEILNIMKDYIYFELEEITQSFISILKTQTNINEKTIFNSFSAFTQQHPFFNEEIISLEFKFLPLLIKESLKEQDEDICISSQYLAKLLSERYSIFIRSLKDKIIIEGNWSINFYGRVASLKKNLTQEIREFITSQGEPKKSELIEQNLNRKLQQLNFMFYEGENENDKVFSHLVQNIFREMDIFQVIVAFLNDTQKQFKVKKKKNLKIDVYSTCFQFISMFLRDNEHNFQRLRNSFLDIKFVFEHPDRGQIKFINHLIKMSKVRSLMIDQIIECVMLSFKHNAQPNPFTILALLNILTYPHIDKQKIESFVDSMLRNSKIFEWILKIREKKGQYQFMWSYRSEDENYHQDWIIYITLVLKFLLIILENSSERTTISIEILKYLDLNKIIHLLQAQDILNSICLQNLEGTLLKKYIMKLFSKIYQYEIEKEANLIQNILAFIQTTFQNLTYTKEDVMGASAVLIDEIMKTRNDHQTIIYESEIYPKSLKTCKAFDANFNQNYLIIIVFYPFIVKVLDIIINSSAFGSNESTIKREAKMLLDSVYRKYKEYVQIKLTYGEFNKFSKQYQNSIYATQELFKRKIGFNFDIEEDQQDLDDYEQEIKDIFMNRHIENTIKCYQFSTNREEKKVYEAFILMFHSSQIREFIQQQEKKYFIQLDQEEIKSMIGFYEKFITERKMNLLQILELFIEQNEEHFRNHESIIIKERVMNLLENQKEDITKKKLLNYLSITNKLFRIMLNKKQGQKLKWNILYPKQGFISRLCKEIQLENKLYSSSKLNEQALIYVQNKSLTFQKYKQNLGIEQVLQWIRNHSILLPTCNRLKYSKIFFEIVDLFKTYCQFIKQFNSKYVSQQLFIKISMTLHIIFHYIAATKEKNTLVNYLIERQIWNDFNLILNLDDSWNKNIEEMNDSVKDTFSRHVRAQTRSGPRDYLSEAYSIYLNSKRIYRDLIPDEYFPLLPIKSFYGSLKSNTIAIMKQFNHFPLQVKQQLFSRIQMATINKNIFEIYHKHEKLFHKYGIPSNQIDIDYKQTDDLRPIANNFILENGIDLTSLKMHIEDICSSGDVKEEYYNLRIETLNSKKIKSAFSSLTQFITDFFLLFIACFINLCRKNNQNEEVIEIQEKKLQEILNFFLQKLGRVQLAYEGKLYNVDFMIRPECRINKDINKKFIQKINFVSMQLKLESIYLQGIYYMLYYKNQISFYRKYNSIRFLTFLTKNFQMIIYLNFGIIVGQNIVLILNSNSDQQYFIDTSLNQPFVWLQIASTVGAVFILIAYFIKDFPLLLQIINEKIRVRSQSYGSNYKNYNIIVKLGIKASMIILNPRFAYHVLYSVIVALVFYNKLFVALLLLDVYFQIPNLKNLLMSIWRPKLQLLLAIISFILVQYFFSIFMFFTFKQQTDPYCNTLGSCFGFIFVTTYKSVGGFVGYLFQESNDKINSVDFFEIFQDIYVVLIYQIFFALILAIIVDTFSLIRNEQSVRKQYLDSCCIVCNLDKTHFNSSKMSFRGHIAINHNIWNYFFYYEYVFNKETSLRTPFQRQILLSKDANWLPNNRSGDISGEQIEMVKGN